MRDDLLAPPKMSPRSHARLVGGISIALIAGGLIYSIFREISAVELGLRILATILVAAAAAWAYAVLVKRAHRLKPEQLPLIHAFTTSLTMAVFITSLAIMLPFFGFGLWWQAPMMFGATLAGAGWARRVGDSMHCPNCEYEFNFDQDDAPIRCPECGAPWLGRLKRGRRVRSPRLAVLGILIAVAAVFLMEPGLYMPSIAPSLPTPLLYATLYISPSSTDECWDEMAKRQLSEHETLALAERVLSCRFRRFYDQAPTRWLESRITAGLVPDDIVTRFYADGFLARLIAPSHVKAGKAFDVGLRVTHTSQGSSDLVIMFGGYTINDAPVVGRADKMVAGYQLRPGLFTAYHDDFDAQLVAPLAASVRVHAVYWVIYQPSFDRLWWQNDGSPVHPPNAAWYERRDLEATVRIDP